MHSSSLFPLTIESVGREFEIEISAVPISPDPPAIQKPPLGGFF